MKYIKYSLWQLHNSIVLDYLDYLYPQAVIKYWFLSNINSLLFHQYKKSQSDNRVRKSVFLA